MAKLQYLSFRKVLRKAIGSRSQARFADLAGISPEHLNRMLNGREINRPNNQTLEKIAAVAKGGVTYQDMVNALDEMDHMGSLSTETSSSPMATRTPECCFSLLREALIKTLENKQCCLVPDIDSFMRFVEVHYMELSNNDVPISYDIGDTFEYFGETYPTATDWTAVEVSVLLFGTTYKTYIMIYTANIKAKETYVVMDASMKVEDYVELFGMPSQMLNKRIEILSDFAEENESDDDIAVQAMNELMEYPFVILSLDDAFTRYSAKRRPASSKLKLMDALFGSRKFAMEDVPSDEYDLERTIVPGFGFKIDSVPSSLASFIKKHKNTIMDYLLADPDEEYDESDETGASSIILARAVNALFDDENATNEDFVKALEDYACYSPYCQSGYIALIADVLCQETAMQFIPLVSVKNFMGDKFQGLSDYNAIMIREENLRGIQFDTLMNAMLRYARELGIQAFGDIDFVTVIKCMQHEMRWYNVDDIVAKKKSERTIDQTAEWVSVDGDNGGYPTETGFYLTELRDGRQMYLFYHTGNKHWIGRHREWNDLVAKWYPERFSPKEQTE